MPQRLSKLTFGFFALAALGSLSVLFKGLLTIGHEPAWGQVIAGWGGALTLLFAIPLFTKPDTRLALVFSLVLVGVCGFAFNAYLVLREPPYAALLREVDAARAQVPGHEPRTPLAVARAMTEAGTPAVPFLVGLFARRRWTERQLLPLGGVSTSTTVLCNEKGPYVTYVSDERGFRNPRGLPEQADVVVLGDSFAHGECVEDGEHSSDLFRARGVSTVNHGASGSGALLELALYHEYVRQRRPKVVLWYFYEENDRQDLLDEYKSPLLRRYLDEPAFSQHLWDKQPEVDAYWHDYLDGLEVAPSSADTGHHLSELVSMYQLRSLLGLRRSAYAPWRQTLVRILQQVQTDLQKTGGRLHFVYLPSWNRVKGQSGIDKDAVLEAVGSAGIAYTDLTPTLMATDDPLSHFPFGLFGHYNAKGHRLLADTVYEDAKLAEFATAPSR